MASSQMEKLSLSKILAHYLSTGMAGGLIVLIRLAGLDCITMSARLDSSSFS